MPRARHKARRSFDAPLKAGVRRLKAGEPRELTPSHDDTCACGDARCVAAAEPAAPCESAPTDASASVVRGLRCSTGFFVLSRAASGARVCAGSVDHFHASVVGERLRFASLSQHVVENVHWVNMSSLAALPGFGGKYRLTISLVETYDRPLSAPPADWDLPVWLRHSRCLWRRVGVSDVSVGEGSSSSSRSALSAEPVCSGGASAGFDGRAMGYATLDADDGCDGHCVGDAAGRILNTSNAQRLEQRMRKGFHHVLKPLGCRLRLYDEHELSRCLGGRSVLNVGSDVAVDVQRGLGRLNSTLAAWTRRRPGSVSEQRLKFSQRVPSAADWTYQYERTGGFNGRGPDVMAGQVRALEFVKNASHAHMHVCACVRIYVCARVCMCVHVGHEYAYVCSLCMWRRVGLARRVQGQCSSTTHPIWA